MFNFQLHFIDDVKKPIENSNLNILSSPSTPVQTQPSIIDAAKSHSDTLPPAVHTINSNEDTSSRIPTPSNIDTLDVNSNAQSTAVPNESQLSTAKPPARKIHIHPRHIPTEDKQPTTRENDSNSTASTEGQNRTLGIPSLKNRQICWHLPKKFQPSIELLEDQLFRLINTVRLLFSSSIFSIRPCF